MEMHGLTKHPAGVAGFRTLPTQTGAIDGVNLVAMFFGGTHHGDRGIFPGLQAADRVKNEGDFERLAAAAEEMLFEVKLLGHGRGFQLFSGAVRSSSTAAARQARRPTTP